MVTWKKHFDTVGLFNESLMSGGDNEWGRRASRLGVGVVYAEDVCVKHPARHSIRDLLKKRKRQAGGNVAIEARENNQEEGAGVPKRNLLRAFSGFFRLCNRADLSMYEKVVATFLFFFFRMYLHYQKLMLRFGLSRPERC
jgi:GT2 family glycosyltransferase